MSSEVMWPVLCVGLGLILILSEGMLPSGGLLGLLALGLIIWGVVLAFQSSVGLGVMVLTGVGLGVPIALGMAVYLWPKSLIARRATLAPPSAEDLRDHRDDHGLDHLIGQYGRALTPLRPSGAVGFEGRRIDAQAEEGLIPSGTMVEAIAIRGRSLLVRAIRDHKIAGLDDLPETLDGPSPDMISS